VWLGWGGGPLPHVFGGGRSTRQILAKVKNIYHTPQLPPRLTKFTTFCYRTIMTNLVPTTAYDLLEPLERAAVDEYVKYAVEKQVRSNQRIANAITLPIPAEYIRRSRDALYKPLLRAAITERITEIARSYDISPDRVIDEHANIAFSTISDFLEPGHYGEVTLKDLKSIPKHKMQALKSIETRPGSYGMAIKVVMHDKFPSLKALGDYMGLVSPDAPPPLRNYVAEKSKEKILEAVPEKAYLELLEQCTQS